MGINRWDWRRIGTVAAVVIITLAAGFVRLFKLSTIPGGLFPDEAAEGVTGHQLLHVSGYNPFFVADNAGRETFFAYCVSMAFRFFGETPTVLRGTSAVVGVLAVLGIGLAMRRFGKATALFAMLWAAGSLWLLCVSRDGMRNIICATIGALILAALLRWYDRPGRRTALLAGAFLGLGLWTYQPLKLAPLLVVAWLWWMRRTDNDHAHGLLRNRRELVLAFVVVAAPILLTAITQPVTYFGRAAGTSVFNPAKDESSFVMHVLRTLGQFLYAGDPNARHDVSGLPLLGPVLIIPAAIGFYALWRRRRDGASQLLLLGLPVFLLAPLLANEGASPHFLRNLGLAPYIAAYVGVGCTGMVAWIRSRAGVSASRLGAAAIVFCLALIGVAGFNSYQARGAADLYGAYSYDVVTMAQAAHGGPGDVVILNSYDAMDIQFLDANNLPTIISPGETIRRPGAYSVIVARTRSDIAKAAGADVADRAQVIGWRPDGKPAAYSVVP